MKNSNNKKSKTVILLFTVALMSSPVFAQEGTEASLKDEIIQQGNQALSQMTMEFGQNAFWKMPNTEQLASQLDEPDFAPETAATTDCDQQNISGEEKKHQSPHKRVFDLVIDFGTSQSPKSTRPLTTYSCPSRPGHQALRNNFASSLLLRTCLPMTGRRVWVPTLLPLWRYAHDG